MRHKAVRLAGLAMVVVTAALASEPGGPLRAAEIVLLSAETWDDAVPTGKEVDCIYGDLVLRNDRIVAVVAAARAGRNANMTTPNVGGGLVDLTERTDPSDQLSAYYPGGSKLEYRALASTPAVSAEQPRATAERIEVRVTAEPSATQRVETVYTLADGWDHVRIETRITNRSQEKPLELKLTDDIRVDGTSFDKVATGDTDVFWAYDKWWGQAYAVAAEGHALRVHADSKPLQIHLGPAAGGELKIEPGQTVAVARRLYPARTQAEAVARARRDLGTELTTMTVKAQVADGGPPIAGADVVARVGKEVLAAARTGTDGTAVLAWPAGRDVLVEASVMNRGTQETRPAKEHTFEFPASGVVVARITDEAGQPLPCKVVFQGRGETRDPFFFHQTGEHAVHNCYYSHDGQFRQELPAGTYEALVAHGTEYDVTYVELEVRGGAETPLEAKLIRSVQTPGWISADFHSHSSPSGDNTSSQLGRVLNLLCEHIEFAPCTEHNRLSTYEPHLKRLGVLGLMGTCTGIELTGLPGDVNHQNAFPMRFDHHPHQERLQDGGGPKNDEDPEAQIARLALWDDGAEKLVQQNHPDIGHVFFDKNGDGVPDGGFQKSLPYIDAMEVHPPHTIFNPPTSGPADRPNNNRIVNWLQLLNQGSRITGVVNTDAHYNFHGSGWLRIYLESPTDDPGKVQTLDVVHAAEHGHVIMTTGPYLEVLVQALDVPEAARRGPQAASFRGTAGDDVVAPGGRVTLGIRVQCPNWFDVDRVQVFRNGRADESLNFTRATTPDRFQGGVIKFDQQLTLSLDEDTHLIVATAGEKSQLGPVMGPEHQSKIPVAVSNPIWVDVDGGGFKPNGDTLGAPLPVMAGRPNRTQPEKE